MKIGDVRRSKHGDGLFLIVKSELSGTAKRFSMLVLAADSEDDQGDVPGELIHLSQSWVKTITVKVNP